MLYAQPWVNLLTSKMQINKIGTHHWCNAVFRKKKINNFNLVKRFFYPFKEILKYIIWSNIMKFGIFKTLLSFVRYFHSYLLSQCIRNKTLKLCPIQIYSSKIRIHLIKIKPFTSFFHFFILMVTALYFTTTKKNIVYRLWNYNVCLAHVLWVLRAIHMQRSSW